VGEVHADFLVLVGLNRGRRYYGHSTSTLDAVPECYVIPAAVANAAARERYADGKRVQLRAARLPEWDSFREAWHLIVDAAGGSWR
jgi:hypothetical protein